MTQLNITPKKEIQPETLSKAELVTTKDTRILFEYEFLAPENDGYGLPRRLRRASPKSVARYLSSNQNKSRAVLFCYELAVRRELSAVLPNGKKIKAAVGDETEKTISPMIITSGSIFPTAALTETVSETEELVHRLRIFYERQYRSYWDRNGKNFKTDTFQSVMNEIAKTYDLSYPEVLRRFKADDEHLGFFTQHFLERVFHRTDLRDKVVGRLKYLKYKAMNDSLEDGLELLNHFITDIKEDSSLGQCKTFLKRVRKERDKAYVLQYGLRFLGLTGDVMVYRRENNEFWHVADFYRKSDKLTVDVLADPASTMSRHAVAVIPQPPYFISDSFVRAIA